MWRDPFQALLLNRPILFLPIHINFFNIQTLHVLVLYCFVMKMCQIPLFASAFWILSFNYSLTFLISCLFLILSSWWLTYFLICISFLLSVITNFMCFFSCKMNSLGQQWGFTWKIWWWCSRSRRWRNTVHQRSCLLSCFFCSYVWRIKILLYLNWTFWFICLFKY